MSPSVSYHLLFALYLSILSITHISYDHIKSQKAQSTKVKKKANSETVLESHNTFTAQVYNEMVRY